MFGPRVCAMATACPVIGIAADASSTTAPAAPASATLVLLPRTINGTGSAPCSLITRPSPLSVIARLVPPDGGRRQKISPAETLLGPRPTRPKPAVQLR
jgi:hypothetical protein